MCNGGVVCVCVCVISWATDLCDGWHEEAKYCTFDLNWQPSPWNREFRLASLPRARSGGAGQNTQINILTIIIDVFYLTICTFT